MTNNTVGRGSDQVKLRLPDGMRDELKEAAKVNGRSMNAEIIARLEDYNDSQSNSNRLDEIRETLIKHDVKLDKLADMLGKLCEVINANTQRTNASDNKSLADNIGWFWVFAGVDQKLFKNGPFANIYDVVADARSKITRDELIAFCQVAKDDAEKRNYITEIRCEIVKASGYTTPIGLLPNQFDESYPLVLACNIPDAVDEIIFPYGEFIKIIASRSLSDFFSDGPLSGRRTRGNPKTAFSRNGKSD
ncbi:Arc family DNA-binding protein [uncultured Bartonella sp.]|uniref:Arc family DNA-binding protein n=1 Tax=uncultured Bartonella sp. TaxID=104108 RepID=UPI0025F5592B|nr:Arc family DNA-binding protein [uncultured Bartonella sp.]